MQIRKKYIFVLLIFVLSTPLCLAANKKSNVATNKKKMTLDITKPKDDKYVLPEIIKEKKNVIKPTVKMPGVSKEQDADTAEKESSTGDATEEKFDLQKMIQRNMVVPILGVSATFHL